MKKSLKIILMMTLLIILVLTTNSLAATSTIKLIPSKTNVTAGEEFTVQVSLEGTEPILGMESRLDYDKNLFELTEKKIETQIKGTDLSGGDEARLDVTTEDPVTSTNIFTLTFKTKENATTKTSEIKLTNIKLVKQDYQELSVADQSISLNVTGNSQNDNNNEDNSNTELKGITLEHTNLNLVLGITTKFNLNVNADPVTATLPQIVWSSSNQNVAKLEQTDSKGNISIVPVAEGKTTITAKTADGKYSATCEVNVQSNGNVSGENNTSNDANTTNTNQRTNSTNTDSTTSANNLPATGEKTKYVLVIVAGLIGIGIVSYIGYKKYKEI